MRFLTSSLFVSLALSICLSSSAYAVTYYVSTSGNDSNSGTSDAQAFRTLQKAADTVQAGDTVIVRAGTYTSGFAIGYSGTGTAGTAQSPIKFLADSGVTITGKAPHTSSSYMSAIDISNGSDYITIQGFTINDNQGNMSGAGIWVTDSKHVNIFQNTCSSTAKWGILTGFADYVDVENNILSGVGQHGIYIGNQTTSPTIRNNTAHDNGRSCIQLNGDKQENPTTTGIIDHALIENNICYNNALTSFAAAISFDGTQQSVIRNNLLYSNRGNGIVLFPADGGVLNGGVDPASINNLVVNNTVVNSKLWSIQIIDGSTGNTVFNNILWNDTSVAGYNYGAIECDTDSASGFHSDYNIVLSGNPTNGAFNTDPNDATPISFAQWQALAAYNHPDTHSIAVSSGSLIFAAYTSPSGANNYNLKTGSKALATGVPTFAGSSAPSIDILGLTRYFDSMDIGAYQFSVGTQPMSNNPTPTPTPTPTATPTPTPRPTATPTPTPRPTATPTPTPTPSGNATPTPTPTATPSSSNGGFSGDSAGGGAPLTADSKAKGCSLQLGSQNPETNPAPFGLMLIFLGTALAVLRIRYSIDRKNISH